MLVYGTTVSFMRMEYGYGLLCATRKIYKLFLFFFAFLFFVRCLSVFIVFLLFWNNHRLADAPHTMFFYDDDDRRHDKMHTKRYMCLLFIIVLRNIMKTASGESEKETKNKQKCIRFCMLGMVRLLSPQNIFNAFNKIIKTKK